jgi:two-component system, cell cycle response regulator DivK
MIRQSGYRFAEKDHATQRSDGPDRFNLNRSWSSAHENIETGGREMPKILLVEDNEMNRDMLTRRLQRHGFTVCAAVDGPSGVAMAGQERPDLILMDVALGAMDGWEATQLIKADPGTAAIPIIALTAHALASDRQKSIEVGCCEFDTKPIDLPRLLEKINSCLSKAGHHQTASAA